MATKGNDIKKPKDRHLDIPEEANRDKHINFVALERGEKDPADVEPDTSWQEKKIRNREDNKTPKPGENDKVY